VLRSVPLLISLLAPYPFKKYKFLIKILSSSVKVILFIHITTVVCQGAWLPWKPCSWYSTRIKLFELNQSATEWQCLVWKIIMGELILMKLCRPALGVQFFWDTVYKELAVGCYTQINYQRPFWLKFHYCKNTVLCYVLIMWFSYVIKFSAFQFCRLSSCISSDGSYTYDDGQF